LFAKAAWAILGITPESEAPFLATINSLTNMYALSQAFAVATLQWTENHNGLMVGINPFEAPRKDEAGPPLGQDFETAAPNTAVFGSGEDDYKISADMPWYGFWLIFNEADDVDDIKSKKEQLSYADYSRPFKFLNKDAKKAVEAAASPLNVGTRKQIPVLLDFKTGRAYIESTNKDEIATVRSTLEDMGIKVYGLTWNFDDSSTWVEDFLNTVNSKNKYEKEMQARAKDIRLGVDIEPLEDKTMENIVSNYFAAAELDSGQWACLYPNVAIKLYDGGESVTVSTASDAFNLLSLDVPSVKPTVFQSGVLFQELDSKFNKKTGAEKQFRTNLFSFDLNQNWALMDEGAALIRGFDIPNFKKDILKAIRKSKQENPVSFYWSEWLRQMNLGIYTFVDNVRLTLGATTQLKKDSSYVSGLVPLDTETPVVTDVIFDGDGTVKVK